MKKNTATKDLEITELIKKEEKRQRETLMMIPSENYASKEVLHALGSILTNKYSEGYSKARYYQGNKIIDQIEMLAIERIKNIFNVPHVNVQPYSGSPANTAVYFALLNPGDKIMGLKLAGGGHLTHGHPEVTFSGKYFTPVQYDVDDNGWIDMEIVAKLAKKEKPKIIVVGTTAYPRVFDWKRWRQIADSINALLMADISHIAGLVIGGVHPSPIAHADIVMFTTHKTFRGPRGAVLMVTKKGLERDPDMAIKIDRAVFPGLQGGPHDNVTAAIAVAAFEADQPAFKKYAKSVVDNAKVLAEALVKYGFTLTTGGTDNHLMVIDLRPKQLVGNVVAEALEVAGIIVNRNSVPHDPNPPFYPSGIRLGTPGLTTRGMGTVEMKQIAKWIKIVVDEVSRYKLPANKAERREFMKGLRKEIQDNAKLKKIALEVKKLARRFPIP